MKTYDAIVVGAGHNGLTTAAFLAKAGLDVVGSQSFTDQGRFATHEDAWTASFDGFDPAFSMASHSTR